jgi:hypothetical protein
MLTLDFKYFLDLIPLILLIILFDFGAVLL